MKNFPMTSTVAITCIASLFVSTPAFAQASFGLLGPYSAGSTSYIVRDVSADGRIVLGDVPLVGPFTWNAASGFTFLPTPAPGEFPASTPGAQLHVGPRELRPDARSMVGVVVFEDERHQGYVWSPTTGYRALAGVAGSGGEVRSFAAATNAAGTLVGGWMQNPNYRQPLVWDLFVSSDAIAIPLLPGHQTGFVQDVAAEASMVIGTSYASVETLPHAFRWTPSGGTVELAAPAGFEDARAECVNRDGSVTFGTADPIGGGPSVLVRWDAQNRSEHIGSPLPGDTTLRIVASNAEGSAMVGISGRGLYYTERSFYWSESTGVVELSSFLESRGATIDASPAHHVLVRGMSADGNTIVGTLQSYGGPAIPVGFVSKLSPVAPVPIGTDLCGPGEMNSIGAHAELTVIGSPVLGHDDLVLEASGLPGRSFGSFIASPTQGLTPGFGGGVGTLCVGASFGVVQGSLASAPAGIFHRTSTRLELPMLSLSTGAMTILPGDTWNFQFWYRDSAAVGTTSNLTSARSITFE
ncbi:hypothetical protein Poly30_33350 [Planctomycetes bacterium Poly30]|uniref:Uncharacterized protein n=1 Tax=Saltatorellus ferox TaxID=2528018 RepID=A0A518EUN5_9BACT|nr:hypothetical protein Poly30_33350 [Planctomycetes bacterium Poly30]